MKITLKIKSTLFTCLFLIIANQLMSQSGGNSVYSEISENKPKGILFDPSIYENNGSVTAKVMIDGVSAGAPKDTLYAFINNELRGLIASQFFPPTSSYLFSLMIFSNKTGTETVEFKYYEFAAKKLHKCNETMIFVKDMIVADANNPFILNVNTIPSEISDNEIDNMKIACHPNPFTGITNIKYRIPGMADVTLSVFDANGKLIRNLLTDKQTGGEYSFQWDASGLSYGIYFIRLQAGNDQMVQRIMYTK